MADWGKRKDGQSYIKKSSSSLMKRGSTKASGIQLNLLGKRKKTAKLKEIWEFDNLGEKNDQNKMDGGLVDKILLRNGEPVLCDSCEKTFATDEEPLSCGDQNYLHEDCEMEMIDNDRSEPILTVIYGDDEDEQKTVGSYHDDTEGDFEASYHSTDAWRGYYDVVPAKWWTNVISDNILSYSDDAADLEEYDKLVRRILDKKEIEYARVFSRTSNVFSTGYDMFVKTKDIKKYNEVQKQIKSIETILRNPLNYRRTALTGSSETTIEGDELMVAAKMIEEGMTDPKKILELIKGENGEEGLKRFRYYGKGVEQ